MNERAARTVMPLAVLAMVLLAWDLVVRGVALPP